jgi:hypothetical protein
MSCCGESRDKPVPEEGNRITPFKEGQPITQQPAAQVSPHWQEKAIFQPPSIATPPPAIPYGHPQNSYGQLHQPWAQQPSTPFNPYAASGSPPPSTNATSPGLFDSSMNGYTSSSPSPPPNTYGLAQPSAAYGANRMTVSGRASAATPLTQRDFAAPSDEGKISVSIDFGMWKMHNV